MKNETSSIRQCLMNWTFRLVFVFVCFFWGFFDRPLFRCPCSLPSRQSWPDSTSVPARGAPPCRPSPRRARSERRGTARSQLRKPRPPHAPGWRAWRRSGSRGSWTTGPPRSGPWRRSWKKACWHQSRSESPTELLSRSRTCRIFTILNTVSSTFGCHCVCFICPCCTVDFWPASGRLPASFMRHCDQ